MWTLGKSEKNKIWNVWNAGMERMERTKWMNGFSIEELLKRVKEKNTFTNFQMEKGQLDWIYLENKRILTTILESTLVGRRRKKLKLIDVKSRCYKRTKKLAWDRKNCRCQWCRGSVNWQISLWWWFVHCHSVSFIFCLTLLIWAIVSLSVVHLGINVWNYTH